MFITYIYSYSDLLFAFKLIMSSHNFHREYLYSVKHHRKRTIKPQTPPTKRDLGENVLHLDLMNGYPAFLISH